MTARNNSSSQFFCHCSAAASSSARIINRLDTANEVVSLFVRILLAD
ncbi:MAG: hypothetical protein IKJ99_04520 [Oscillospiraceae bacterium]|nr:hypothetical protein [Oscillospiraceae bacterium]